MLKQSRSTRLPLAGAASLVVCEECPNFQNSFLMTIGSRLASLRLTRF